ncbi:hypothetical protein FPQ18DRAFT_354581 [Pyronema domesticum]|nr:hypothetical protein FPQ18DRAFT_354581 [Pyronema domesticum]
MSDTAGGFMPTTTPMTPPQSSQPAPSPIRPLLTTKKRMERFENRLTQVHRRHITRFTQGGYEYSQEFVQDLLLILNDMPDEMQCLLQIANVFNENLYGYSIKWDEWNKIFELLRKLDEAFYAKLTAPLETGKRGVDMTEKVRLKSLIERTRMHIVQLPEDGHDDGENEDGEDPEVLPQEESDSEDEVEPVKGAMQLAAEGVKQGEAGRVPVECTPGGMLDMPSDVNERREEELEELDDDDDEEDEAELEWEIEVSRVYIKTMEVLGETLS